MVSFLQQYGYLFVIIGTFFGGETVLAMAGFAAHQGYLLLPWTIAAGCLGNFLENLTWFLAGRFYGPTAVQKYPNLKVRVERMEEWVRRYQGWVVVGVRFLAGFRTAGAIAIGASDVGIGRFVVFNLLGALLWAAVTGLVGYFFGTAVKSVMGDLKDIEWMVLGFMLAAGICVWLYVRWRTRHVGSGQTIEHGKGPAGAA